MRSRLNPDRPGASGRATDGSRRCRSPAVQLDHIGWVTRDLTPLMTAFDRLGFRLTEPRLVACQDMATGEQRSNGQSHCHAIFEQGYLELVAVPSPTVADDFAHYLPPGSSFKIIAIGADDVFERHATALHAGLRPTQPVVASRAVHYGSRRGHARFRSFMLPSELAPEALVCVVRQLTPELVYQREVQRHPNGAVALAGVTLCIDDLELATVRYQALLGIAPGCAGGTDGIREFSLGCQWLRLATPAALRDEYPGARLAAAPRCVGLTISVNSLAKAAALLGSNDVEFRRHGGAGIWTAIGPGSSTFIEFVART